MASASLPSPAKAQNPRNQTTADSHHGGSSGRGYELGCFWRQRMKKCALWRDNDGYWRGLKNLVKTIISRFLQTGNIPYPMIVVKWQFHSCAMANGPGAAHIQAYFCIFYTFGETVYNHSPLKYTTTLSQVAALGRTAG